MQWPWTSRLAALEKRLRDLEDEELQLAELRRTAANAVRSLTRAAANASARTNATPPLTAPLTLAEARRRVQERATP